MKIQVLLFPDLLSWEAESIQPLIHSMQNEHSVQVTWLKDWSLKTFHPHADVVWALARDWRRSYRMCLAKKGMGRLIVSVFALDPPRRNLFTLLWSRLFQRPIPKSIELFVHSPINARFFHEIEGVEEGKVHFVGLPHPGTPRSMDPPTSDKRAVFRVCTLSRFSSESNLHFFMSVAHYVLHRRRDVEFHLWGAGPLFRHLIDQVSELGLTGSVFIHKTETLAEIESSDVFLYVPSRNDHFLPLLSAADLGLPILANDVPGITDYLEDGKTGFVVGNHETKAMGELVLRMLDNPDLRRSIARECGNSLSARFSADRVAAEYLAVFGGNAQETRNARKAA